MLQVFQFFNGKCEVLYKMKRNLREINWIVLYRRKYKKGNFEEIVKKRIRRIIKFIRVVIGFFFVEIQVKRNQKLEVRKVQREQVIRLVNFKDLILYIGMNKN